MPDPSDRMARLQLLGEVARGGMGVIFKGHDAELGRDLAIKVLLDQHRENPDLIRRSPDLCELGTLADDRPYFAMKLVQGRTLGVFC